MRAEGRTVEEIAATVGLSRSRVFEVLRDEREAAREDVPEGFADLDIERVVVEAVTAGCDVARDLGRLGREASHEGARVGALRGRASVMFDLVRLLASMGALPPTSRYWLVEREIRDFACLTVEALHGLSDRLASLDLSEEVRFELAAALRPALAIFEGGPPRPRSEVAA